jgi:hypothetical protein
MHKILLATATTILTLLNYFAVFTPAFGAVHTQIVDFNSRLEGPSGELYLNGRLEFPSDLEFSGYWGLLGKLGSSIEASNETNHQGVRLKLGYPDAVAAPTLVASGGSVHVLQRSDPWQWGGLKDKFIFEFTSEDIAVLDSYSPSTLRDGGILDTKSVEISLFSDYPSWYHGEKGFPGLGEQEDFLVREFADLNAEDIFQAVIELDLERPHWGTETYVGGLGYIRTSEVPLPAAGWLLLAGLSALVMARARVRNA